MTQLHAVLFDLGDTLVDLGEGRGDYEARVVARAGRVWDALHAAGLAPRERDAFAQALAHESETRYQAALAAQRGIDIFDVLAAFLPQWGISNDAATTRLVADAFYQASGPAAGLRPGAAEMLAELRGRGFHLGVISNTLQPRRYMDASLARRGIAEFFQVTIYSSEERVAKPHPAIFRAALQALGVPAAHAVYVGDRLETDVAGAHGVGMKAVLIATPHRSSSQDGPSPDATIAELTELPSLLPQLLAQPPTNQRTNYHTTASRSIVAASSGGTGLM